MRKDACRNSANASKKVTLQLAVYVVKAYMGRKCTAPLILNLDTQCRCVVSFKPRPLYPLGGGTRDTDCIGSC
jgi:hypothetical protein